jgi:ATP-dependent RNA/DNA helicase IGHMBP2
LRKTRDKGERQRLREELKSLRREYREREKAAVTSILEHADVVLCTLTGASNDGPLKHLSQSHFDLVVIDECSQVTDVSEPLV